MYKLLFLQIFILSSHALPVYGEAPAKHGFDEFYKRVLRNAGNNNAASLQEIKRQTVLKQQESQNRALEEKAKAWREKTQAQSKLENLDQRKDKARPSQEEVKDRAPRKNDRGAITEFGNEPQGLSFGKSQGKNSKPASADSNEKNWGQLQFGRQSE